MGNLWDGSSLNGLIFNASHFPIYYSVYGCFQQEGHQKHSLQIKPQVKVGTQQIGFGGVAKNTQQYIKNVYKSSSLQIPPGRYSTIGLKGLAANKHKLTIWALLQFGQVFILSDCILKTNDDMCIKIRRDLSFKQFKPKRVQQILQHKSNAKWKEGQQKYQGPELPKLKAMKPQEIEVLVRLFEANKISKRQESQKHLKKINDAWIRDHPNQQESDKQ